MRLLSSKRLANRQISYEFMNRQMVWHAFTVSQNNYDFMSSVYGHRHRNFCCWFFLSLAPGLSEGLTNKWLQVCEISSPLLRSPYAERRQFGRGNTFHCPPTSAQFAQTTLHSTCLHSRMIQQVSHQALSVRRCRLQHLKLLKRQEGPQAFQ